MSKEDLIRDYNTCDSGVRYTMTFPHEKDIEQAILYDLSVEEYRKTIVNEWNDWIKRTQSLRDFYLGK